MSGTSQERVFTPFRGPPISGVRLQVLEHLYDSLDKIPEGDVRREACLGSIDFILRKNCLCPEESPHCMCGGGYGYIGGRTNL